MKGLSRIDLPEQKFRLSIELIIPKVIDQSSFRILSLPTDFFDNLPDTIGPTKHGQDYCLHWRLQLNKTPNTLNSTKLFGQGKIEILSMDNLQRDFAKGLYIGTVALSFNDDVDAGAGVNGFREMSSFPSTYLPFISGQSDIASGVIHLLKESPPQEPQKFDFQNSMQLYRNHGVEENSSSLGVIYEFPERNVILILAIPSIMTPSDLIHFIGSDHSGRIEKIRLIRDAAPNRYMAVIKFIDFESALAFADSNNGKNFSPLEPEICQVIFIQSIEFSTKASILEPLFDESEFSSLNCEFKDSSCFTEVPNCPVCLERVDSSATGIITVICNHKFHCQCLSRWSDGRCPVCRYSLQGEKRSNSTVCSTCGSVENIWICLICGNSGCGRYDEGHAYDHYCTTSHCFAMELDSHRVWDYIGDNYVHRLIQNKEDGKLVEIPSPLEHHRPNENLMKSDFDPDYYATLLVAQLESQRIFYEDRLEDMEVTFIERIERLDKKHVFELEELQSRAGNFESQVELSKRQIKSLKLKIEKLSEERNFLMNELSSERAISSQAVKMAEMYKGMIEERDKQIKELEFQVHDLIVHIDNQQKLALSELAGGSIVLAPKHAKNRHRK